MAVTYQEWTAKDIEHRVLEAADTLMLMPGEKGPTWARGSMPDGKPDSFNMAYGSAPATYKRRPVAAAIDRMYECWKWINELEKAEDRKLLYGWAYVKARKGMKLSRFALENMMNDRQMRRKIDQLTQMIANNLNRLYQVRLTVGLDSVSENDDNSHQQTVSSEKCATHWRAPDAKPKNIPSLHEKMKPAA
ncbi:hypothetical protein KCX83_21320 [Brucella oryzae]|uniref:DUF6362 family protein n=1 Tax=Brucella oryzae TaxID=335286 RepID=UPI001B83299E|nr:DUF6362 family protein [Brucella oryzae]MBR7654834.1 hypothetical protein [Brucella oryzae]